MDNYNPIYSIPFGLAGGSPAYTEKGFHRFDYNSSESELVYVLTV